jgi:hypothetical protein
LQQVQLGVEGLGRIRNEILRMGQGTAKENPEEKDIEPVSGEKGQGNRPESETLLLLFKMFIGSKRQFT